MARTGAFFSTTAMPLLGVNVGVVCAAGVRGSAHAAGYCCRCRRWQWPPPAQAWVRGRGTERVFLPNRDQRQPS